MSEPTTDVAVIESSIDAEKIIEQFKNNTGAVYSSIDTDSHAARIAVVQALSDTVNLNEHYGETINLVDFVTQAVEIRQPDGSMAEAIRTVLIAEDGTAYHTVSNGIMKSLMMITGVVGHPRQWEKPVQVVAEEKRARDGVNRYATLTVLG